MTGVRLLIPRSAVHRIVTGAMIAGCVLIGCAALAGCGDHNPVERRTAPPASVVRVEWSARDHSEAHEFSPRPGVTCWAWGGYGGGLACVQDCPCETPAEAPEGGRP